MTFASRTARIIRVRPAWAVGDISGSLPGSLHFGTTTSGTHSTSFGSSKVCVNPALRAQTEAVSTNISSWALLGRSRVRRCSKGVVEEEVAFVAKSSYMLAMTSFPDGGKSGSGALGFPGPPGDASDCHAAARLSALLSRRSSEPASFTVSDDAGESVGLPSSLVKALEAAATSLSPP